MRKLLSAGFLRLRKNRMFYILLLSMFGLGLFLVFGKYSDMVNYGAEGFLDDFLFLYGICSCLCSAIFCSMFTGSEFSSGTIRNKLIVGHFRRDAYISGLILSIVAALLSAIAFLLPYCAFGIFLFQPPRASAAELAAFALLSLFTITASVSLYHMITVLTGKKSTAAILCLLLFIGMFLFSSYLFNRLNAPEFITEYALSANGSVKESAPTPNPRYLTGAAKAVHQFLFESLPSGQCLQLMMEHVERPALLLASSSCITVITTVAGILGFEKKDLK